MELDIKAVLDTAAPATSLVFASWLLLQYLTQRYASAFEQYQSMIKLYRNPDEKGIRRESIHDQILQYKSRCEDLRKAVNAGLTAALCLLATVASGVISLVFKQPFVISLISLISLISGVVLLMRCALLALRENALQQHSIDGELRDIPEFNDNIS